MDNWVGFKTYNNRIEAQAELLEANKVPTKIIKRDPSLAWYNLLPFGYRTI